MLQCIVITAGVICVALICTQEIIEHAAVAETDAFAESSADSEQLAEISKESETNVLQDTERSEDTEETEASESKRMETQAVPKQRFWKKHPKKREMKF